MWEGSPLFYWNFPSVIDLKNRKIVDNRRFASSLFCIFRLVSGLSLSSKKLRLLAQGDTCKEVALIFLWADIKPLDVAPLLIMVRN